MGKQIETAIPLVTISTEVEKNESDDASEVRCPFWLRFFLTPATQFVDHLLTPNSRQIDRLYNHIAGLHVLCWLRLLVIPLLFIIVGLTQIIFQDLVLVKNRLHRTPNATTDLGAVYSAWNKISFPYQCFWHEIVALGLVLWIVVVSLTKNPVHFAPVQWIAIYKFFDYVFVSFGHHYTRLQNEFHNFMNMELIKEDLKQWMPEFYKFPILNVNYQYAPIVRVTVELITAGFFFAFIYLIERVMLFHGYGRRLDALYKYVQRKI
ncbi:hypothetical protein M3Y96_00021900 [Aphelenchoides besseyi]|nr:hypothetical protein M3Y96_00021900 [Aphelenchoides besseyi]